MENEELYVLYLKEGDKIIYQNTFLKKGIILENYKNGQFKVRNTKNEEEIITAEEIIFDL